MAIKHVDGDFGAEHFSRDFGFHGSSEGAEMPKMARGGHHEGHKRHHYAKGGGVDENAGGVKDKESRGYGLEDHDMGYPEKGGTDRELNGGHEDAAFAMGGHMEHPHGHRIVHTEVRPNGTKVHHHDHGGHSVEHVHGGMTHHMHDGTPLHHMAHGGMEHRHDSSEYVHRARGGHEEHRAHGGHMEHRARGGHHPDEREDKAMIEKAFREHDKDLHHGEHEELHLARGGAHVPLPHGMRLPQARHHSPINTPPRNPNMTTTPKNDMAGGQMAYGNQPSAEPDEAGADQGIPQMRRGGHHERRREEREED